MTPFVTAAPALILIALGYALLCAASPFGNCRACKGMGCKTRVTRRGTVKRGRDCRRCRATGRRLRLGRRLYNHGNRAADAARRARTDAQP
nr:hypothetical protein [Kitasatospora sp. MAA4]